MITKPVLTIGIPAYNEGQNIGFLLDSIMKQQQNNFYLNKIIVVTDGCTDDTDVVVKRYQKEFPLIELHSLPVRQGKAHALNSIYDESDTEFLLTFDADVVLKRHNEIEIMVEKIEEHAQRTLVGGRFIPVPQTSLMGKFSVLSYLIIEDAIFNLNNGNNIYALIGAANLMRKKLYKSFQYTHGTISDQNYLYMKNIEMKGVFQVARDTQIYIRTVSTFKDWRILAARSVYADKENIYKYFGEKARRQYAMPRNVYLHSLWKFFKKYPWYTAGSTAMNVFIRLFPKRKAVAKEGIWELARSSKKAIIL